MPVKYNSITKIESRELIIALLQKFWILIISIIIGSLIIGFINLYFVPPIYTSTSSIYIINRQDETKTTLTDMNTGKQLTQDYMILVTSRDVMEQVIQKIGIDMSPWELASMISIDNPDETRILQISVTDIDPATAKRLVDAVVEVSSELLIKVMDIDKVNIIDYGNLPTKPTGQNLGRSFFSGGMVGLVISSFIIIARYMLNENIKSSDDIERLLGITTLGLIPVGDGKLKDKKIYKRKRKKVAYDG